MAEELIAFLNARLDEKQMHAEKDLWCARRASAGWEAHYGYNLPYSELWAGGQVIARFTGTRGLPLADGEDDQHQADLFLAARTGSAAESRAVRALREVAALREILAEHRQGDGDSVWCHRCDPGADLNYHRAYFPCFAVCQLAAVYSDHPGYRQEWAP